MFFNKKYINDDNISSISFWVYSSEEKYRVVKYYNQKKALTEFWRVNENKIFVLLDKNGNVDRTMKDGEYSGDPMSEWSQEDIEQRELINTLKEAPSNDTFTNKQGEIEVTVKMNNGDSFSHNIMKWRTAYIMKDFKVELYSHSDKEYDEEIDIETIYNYLQKGNSNKKVMI